jgi:multidrug efflux pump subunit AcrA (membrane-fusion protein)
VQAKSQLNTAVVNREHTVITAPIDGIIIQRAVEPGQTVNAGMSAPKLFVIAADLTKMQVNANIDEADVGSMRPGQHVTFRVDAFPNDTFLGTVQQVRLQPTTVQNVVTYQTVIEVPNQQYKLKPGMTANVTIEIARKSNVLRLPSAATRFRPTAEIFAALKQEPPPDFGRGGFGGRGRNAGGTGGPGGPTGNGQRPSGAAPTTGGAPAAAAAGTPGNAPSQTANVNPGAQNQGQGQGQSPRQRDASANEARGGGDRMAGGAPPAAQGGDPNGGGRGGFGGGGGRGGFDPNMTPEERRKRMEERMAAMTPEERAAFQERMAQRAAQGGRGGGFGGDGQGGGRGGFNPGQGNGPRAAGPAQPTNAQNTNAANANRTGRVANTPTMAGSATTIDSLFGALPTIETRGQAWLYENKQLKQVRLRLGISDGTNTEVIDANPEIKEGSEIVTNVIIDTGAPTTGPNNTNNPLLGPQRRGGPGGPGGPGGGGGGRGGR